MIEGIVDLCRSPGLYNVGVLLLMVGFLAIVSGLLIGKRSRVGLYIGVFLTVVTVLDYLSAFSSKLFVNMGTVVDYADRFSDAAAISFVGALLRSFNVISLLGEEEKSTEERQESKLPQNG